MTFSGPVINQSALGIYLSHIIIFLINCNIKLLNGLGNIFNRHRACERKLACGYNIHGLYVCVSVNFECNFATIPVPYFKNASKLWLPGNRIYIFKEKRFCNGKLEFCIANILKFDVLNVKQGGTYL